MMRGDTRLRGMAAMVGGVLALLITPVFTASYLESGEETPTPVIEAIQSAAEPFLDFASTDTVYQTYGRIYMVAALLMAFGLHALRDYVGNQSGRAGSWGIVLFSTGWVMFLVGLVGDYAIGDALGDTLHNASFAVEMLGVLALLFGALMLGLAVRRSQVLPSWGAWLLILALPLGIVGLVIFSHLPSGPMLGMYVAAVGCGSILRSGVPGLPVEPQRGTMAT